MIQDNNARMQNGSTTRGFADRGGRRRSMTSYNRNSRPFVNRAPPQRYHPEPRHQAPYRQALHHPEPHHPEPHHQEPYHQAPHHQDLYQQASRKVVVWRNVRGVVKWFSPEKHYGFIECFDTNEDVFVHAEALIQYGGSRYALTQSQVVEFDIVEEADGRRRAVTVALDGGHAIYSNCLLARPRRMTGSSRPGSVNREGRSPTPSNHEPNSSVFTTTDAENQPVCNDHPPENEPVSDERLPENVSPPSNQTGQPTGSRPKLQKISAPTNISDQQQPQETANVPVAADNRQQQQVVESWRATAMQRPHKTVETQTTLPDRPQQQDTAVEQQQPQVVESASSSAMMQQPQNSVGTLNAPPQQHTIANIPLAAANQQEMRSSTAAMQPPQSTVETRGAPDQRQQQHTNVSVQVAAANQQQVVESSIGTAQPPQSTVETRKAPEQHHATSTSETPPPDRSKEHQGSKSKRWASLFKK